MKFPIASNQLIIIELLALGIPAFVLALEQNNNIIKGNFLLNVLTKALPGAVVVVISIMNIYGFDSGSRYNGCVQGLRRRDNLRIRFQV